MRRHVWREHYVSTVGLLREAFRAFSTDCPPKSHASRCYMSRVANSSHQPRQFFPLNIERGRPVDGRTPPWQPRPAAVNHSVQIDRALAGTALDPARQSFPPAVQVLQIAGAATSDNVGPPATAGPTASDSLCSTVRQAYLSSNNTLRANSDLLSDRTLSIRCEENWDPRSGEILRSRQRWNDSAVFRSMHSAQTAPRRALCVVCDGAKSDAG